MSLPPEIPESTLLTIAHEHSALLRYDVNLSLPVAPVDLAAMRLRAACRYPSQYELAEAWDDRHALLEQVQKLEEYISFAWESGWRP